MGAGPLQPQVLLRTFGEPPVAVAISGRAGNRKTPFRDDGDSSEHQPVGSPSRAELLYAVRVRARLNAFFLLVGAELRGRRAKRRNVRLLLTAGEACSERVTMQQEVIGDGCSPFANPRPTRIFSPDREGSNFPPSMNTAAAVQDAFADEHLMRVVPVVLGGDFISWACLPRRHDDCQCRNRKRAG